MNWFFFAELCPVTFSRKEVFFNAIYKGKKVGRAKKAGLNFKSLSKSIYNISTYVLLQERHLNASPSPAVSHQRFRTRGPPWSMGPPSGGVLLAMSASPGSGWSMNRVSKNALWVICWISDGFGTKTSRKPNKRTELLRNEYIKRVQHVNETLWKFHPLFALGYSTILGLIALSQHLDTGLLLVLWC